MGCSSLFKCLNKQFYLATGMKGILVMSGQVSKAVCEPFSLCQLVIL